MGTRGPKSSEELMTRALADASTVHRLEPPLELWRDDEAEVWRRIVEALPADWFTAADAPLLVQYVRHIVQARRVAQLLRQLEHGKGDIDLDVWTKLMRAQDAQTAAICRLATKMRLSQRRPTVIARLTPPSATPRAAGGRGIGMMEPLRRIKRSSAVDEHGTVSGVYGF